MIKNKTYEKIIGSFPVGYFDFSNIEAMNYQLNRYYSFGLFDRDELYSIGQRADNFEKWIKIFTELGEKAEAEGNILRAATCIRAAHFYTLSDVKDTSGKSPKSKLYERCRSLYDRYYAQFEDLEYVSIPFDEYAIPVYFSKAADAKGTIVLHGGYDSLIQEFLGLYSYFTALGYDVYFFEGPGQGEVLMRYDVRMTEKWEDCTGAVLDYFGLDDVTLIGVSLGGYLAARAAALDKRITRLVMFDLIYDFYGAVIGKMGKLKGKFFDCMTGHPHSFIWKYLDKKLDENYFTKWLMGQGYSIYKDVHTPCEYFNYIRRFNTRDISKLITQDTLVLAGESDLYTIYYDEQLKALTNAKSVTGRLFTKEENADHHCQIGNIGLLLKTITDWTEEKTNG